MRRLYDTSRWDRIKEKAMARDGYLCRECARYGRRTPAEIVHHIEHAEDAPEKRFEMSNLVSLCKGCHNKAHPEKGSPPGRCRNYQNLG